MGALRWGVRTVCHVGEVELSEREVALDAKRQKDDTQANITPWTYVVNVGTKNQYFMT